MYIACLANQHTLCSLMKSVSQWLNNVCWSGCLEIPLQPQTMHRSISKNGVYLKHYMSIIGEYDAKPLESWYPNMKNHWLCSVEPLDATEIRG